MGYERERSARQQALDLSKRKDAIEAEMDAIFESLTVRLSLFVSPPIAPLLPCSSSAISARANT